MNNYSKQTWYAHLFDCNFAFFYFISLVNATFPQLLFSSVIRLRQVVKVVPLHFFSPLCQQFKSAFRSNTPTYIISTMQPSPHVDPRSPFWRTTRAKCVNVAAPKATCQDYWIPTIILLLIVPNIFIRENSKASCGKNKGPHVRRSLRFMHFLITGKYKGIACRVFRFKTKTNSKECLLRMQFVEGSKMNQYHILS